MLSNKTFNLTQHVMAAGTLQGDKTALELIALEGKTSYTYADLNTAIEQMAAGLVNAGIAKGDIIVLRLGNTLDFPIAFLGAIYAGIIPAPISQQLTTIEIATICENLSTRAIVTNEVDLVSSQRIIQIGELHRNEQTVPCDLGDANRPAYIIHTSGTSGTPRAVVHAHRAILARKMMWDGWYGLRSSDRIMHAGAFNWTYTLGTGLLDPWTIGATALIPLPDTDAADLPKLMAKHHATIFAAAPGVYRRLLRADIPNLPQLRHGLSAGEKLPAALRTAWHTKTGTNIHEAFGMSECSTFISGSPNRPSPEHSLGYPQAGRRVQIMQDGQIAVHKDDAGLMLGYHNQPDETAARYHGDWFLTGDMGQMADDGAITYAGRADDMMNAGGYRVSPVEVEEALNTHPLIHDVAACAVQLRTDTTLIAAFYTAQKLIDEDALRAHMAEHLASYKCPRIYIHRPALPRGANNKLLRRVLRTQWETEHGQA